MVVAIRGCLHPVGFLEGQEPPRRRVGRGGADTGAGVRGDDLEVDLPAEGDAEGVRCVRRDPRARGHGEFVDHPDDVASAQRGESDTADEGYHVEHQPGFVRHDRRRLV